MQKERINQMSKKGIIYTLVLTLLAFVVFYSFIRNNKQIINGYRPKIMQSNLQFKSLPIPVQKCFVFITQNDSLYLKRNQYLYLSGNICEKKGKIDLINAKDNPISTIIFGQVYIIPVNNYKLILNLDKKRSPFIVYGNLLYGCEEMPRFKFHPKGEVRPEIDEITFFNVVLK